MSLFPDIRAVVADAIRGQIEIDHTPAVTARVEHILNDWLTVTGKKQLPDLIQRTDDFRKRIHVLAATVSLAFTDGQLVVKATGDAETTLRMIRRGTDWFEPMDDVDKLIAGAMLSE